MIRIELQVELSYQVDARGADFIFNVHAAHTPHQTVSSERLELSQRSSRGCMWAHDGHALSAAGRPARSLAAAPLHDSATVDLAHHSTDPAQLAEVPVQRHVTFTPDTSNSSTSAVDTLIERVGICRDFAHLMIALCRAVDIPARFAGATDDGADPALGPPDFHADVEVYLGDRWYMFDPSGTAIPMGLVRFGTGRDAADVAFATILGGVASQAPLVRGRAIEDAARGLKLPHHCREALSTDGRPEVTDG